MRFSRTLAWVFVIEAVGTILAAAALWITVPGEREKGVAD